MKRVRRGAFGALLIVELACGGATRDGAAAGNLASLGAIAAPSHARIDAGELQPLGPADSAVIAQTHRQWVLAVRPGTTGALTRMGRRAMPARLAARLGTLGLEPIRTLADPPGGLDLDRALEARALANAAANPAANSPSDRNNPFGLDPARVWLLQAPDSAAGALSAAALAAEPDVEWLEPNVPRRITGWIDGPNGANGARAPITTRGIPFLTSGAAGVPEFPNDPLFRWGHQWALFNVGQAGEFGGLPRADNHATEGWAITTGRDDVILSVADTGIDPAQPDLAGLIAGGRPRLLSPINLTGVDPPDSFFDERGHGTMCAGVMAARSNNGVSVDTLGMAGVCGGDGTTNSGCRIVPMKVTVGNTEETSSYDLAQAMLYAAALGARAMNLSIAGTESSQIERLALYDAITHGCVVSAAAGNSGSQAFPLYPSAYAIDGLCIEVGASDGNDQRSYFSTYGPWLDLVAPGENIYGTFMTYPNAFGGVFPGYVAGSGTSFAAPQVAGAVGLLCSIRPELIENDFQRIIRESAHDLGEAGVDSTTAWGRLDLGAALGAVPASVGIWHGQAPGVLGELIATDTLVIADSSQAAGGPPPRVWPNAREYQVTATVAIPDSFSGAVRIWPRVGVTSTVRAGFKLAYFAPWAEVEAQNPHSFTLRGYVYQSSDTCAGCDAFVPVPLSDLAFAFTVIGPVRRGGPPPPAVGTLLIAPNPAVGLARITTAPGATVTILDPAGRRVRQVTVDPLTGVWDWDGLDSSGRRVRAGVYVVRSRSGGLTRDSKLVKL